MRCGKRILAMCGIIALLGSYGVADEKQLPSVHPLGQQNGGDVFFSPTTSVQSGARSGAGSVLSGTLPARRTTPSGSFSGGLSSRSARESAARTGFIQQAGFEEPSRLRARDGRPASADLQPQVELNAVPTDSGVIHAEYQHGPGETQGMIQQIQAEQGPSADSGDAGPVNRAAPFPPMDDATVASDQPGRIGEAAAASAEAISEAPEVPIGAQTPQVTVEWIKRGDINVGQECRFDLVVKNGGQVPAAEVSVEARFPSTVRLTNAEPKPSKVGGAVTWEFAEILPGQQQVIAISMIPSERGELATQALVRFTGMASGVFKVAEPMLEVAIDGVESVVIGEPAAHVITVSNPGTGIVRSISIEALIPPGLEHPRGDRLVMDIGALSPGESRRVRLSLVAIAGGKHSIEVRATGDNDLQQAAVAEVDVIAPSLKLELDGPGLRYLGRSAKYDLVITNDGSIASSNVRAKYKVPEGFKFERADMGGKYDRTSRTIDWFVGTIEAGQSRTLQLYLSTTELGTFSHQAVVVSEHGARSADVLETRVEGSASLVLDIIDENDPVEVGTDTTYEIRVSNAGSKAAQLVGVSCELSAGVELVGAEGPTDYIAENGLLVFKSLSKLEPGQKVSYRVIVRGKQEGNHRFRARLASESITEPLIFEELTKFYGE